MRGSFECIYADNTIFAHLGFSSVCTRGKHNPTDYRLVNHSFVPGSGRGALYIRSCVQAVGMGEQATQMASGACLKSHG